jgi:hypothetical protein
MVGAGLRNYSPELVADQNLPLLLLARSIQ